MLPTRAAPVRAATPELGEACKGVLQPPLKCSRPHTPQCFPVCCHAPPPPPRPTRADDPSVFTFSMHCATQSFPEQRRSDLDVGLAAGMGDEEYMQVTVQGWTCRHCPAARG